MCTWEGKAGGTAPTALECQAKVSGILEWLFGVWYTEVSLGPEGRRRIHKTLPVAGAASQSHATPMVHEVVDRVLFRSIPSLVLLFCFMAAAGTCLFGHSRRDAEYEAASLR